MSDQNFKVHYELTHYIMIAEVLFFDELDKLKPGEILTVEMGHIPISKEKNRGLIINDKYVLCEALPVRWFSFKLSDDETTLFFKKLFEEMNSFLINKGFSKLTCSGHTQYTLVL